MERDNVNRPAFGPVRISEAAVASVLVLAACWASGTTGLMTETLRIVGTWLLLGTAVLLTGIGRMTVMPRPFWQRLGPSSESNRGVQADRSRIRQNSECSRATEFWRIRLRKSFKALPFGAWGLLILLLVLPHTGWTDARHEILLVAAFAACLADSHRGAARSMLSSVASGILLWAILAIVSRSNTAIWRLTEHCGLWMGDVAGRLSGTQLSIGSSFGAVPLLMLLAILYALWLKTASGRRLGRAVLAIVLVVGAHLGYLHLLARSPDLIAALPEVAERPFEHPYTPPPWAWSAAVNTLLPWNLPLLAAIVHSSLLGLLFRWSRWPIHDTTDQHAPKIGDCCPRMNSWLRGTGGMVVLIVLAVTVTLVSDLAWGRSDLAGKVILANGQGRVDWRQPVHDRYGRQSAGMFGMLPEFVQSLGGELRIVQRWDENELSEADAVVLLHPTNELSAACREHILAYVQRGGRLLVVAEPHLRQGDAVSDHNEVLAGTSISVRRDVAVPMTSGWQHALQVTSHPATANIHRRLNHHFSGIGSSLEIRWPARPVLIGRWGWSDPGSDSLFTGVQRWEIGERLGDLVLVAEQSWGRGRVLVIGDGHSLTNEGGFRGYWFAGSLLAYLVDGTSDRLAWGRQILLLVLALGLIVALLTRSQPGCQWMVATVLALGIAIWQPINAHATRIVPDGRLLVDDRDRIASRLAYVGGSHAEAYSDATWSIDGIEGLALTLMRNDLLALHLPRLTREHLSAAGVYISLAPSRTFSTAERRMLVDFVKRGGILICTVGAEESRGSRALLADFGIRVPPSPVPTVSTDFEPEPMGRTRALYLRVEQPDGAVHDLGVNFFAGWPVEWIGDQGEVMVYGHGERPLAVRRSFGQGKVVVIGDSGFALNKNLEHFGGEPVQGGYENAHFWRWLLTDLVDGQLWLPPLESENVMTPNFEQEVP